MGLESSVSRRQLLQLSKAGASLLLLASCGSRPVPETPTPVKLPTRIPPTPTRRPETPTAVIPKTPTEIPLPQLPSPEVSKFPEGKLLYTEDITGNFWARRLYSSQVDGSNRKLLFEGYFGPASLYGPPSLYLSPSQSRFALFTGYLKQDERSGYQKTPYVSDKPEWLIYNSSGQVVKKIEMQAPSFGSDRYSDMQYYRCSPEGVLWNNTEDELSIYYSDDEGYYLYDLAAKRNKIIFGTRKDTVDNSLSIAPDNTRFAFVHHTSQIYYSVRLGILGDTPDKNGWYGANIHDGAYGSIPGGDDDDTKISWTPDSNRIAFMYNDKITVQEWSGEVKKIDIPKQNAVKYTMSNDGKAIVVPLKGHDFFVTDLDGQNLRTLQLHDPLIKTVNPIGLISDAIFLPGNEIIAMSVRRATQQEPYRSSIVFVTKGGDFLGGFYSHDSIHSVKWLPSK